MALKTDTLLQFGDHLSNWNWNKSKLKGRDEQMIKELSKGGLKWKKNTAFLKEVGPFTIGQIRPIHS
ncbi:hypothetical protein J27TS8_09920 [Robertmurraya siralis]|uniref:Uncharacterized protein n=1 Tax=Robertmurraya siralis TaxID=77777 RepID=A0A919WFT5_9BACI|nr:hypothetical protein J27TS8_09920 [Robertmurraya siralis]